MKDYNIAISLEELLKHKPIDILDCYYDDDIVSLLNNKCYIPHECRNCRNHPSNGGSGICHCILGVPTIY